MWNIRVLFPQLLESMFIGGSLQFVKEISGKYRKKEITTVSRRDPGMHSATQIGDIYQCLISEYKTPVNQNSGFSIRMEGLCTYVSWSGLYWNLVKEAWPACPVVVQWNQIPGFWLCGDYTSWRYKDTESECREWGFFVVIKFVARQALLLLFLYYSPQISGKAALYCDSLS